MRRLVLYHGNCPDGFGAAWAAFLKFGADAEYIPVSYGQEAPPVTGAEVYVLDFSWPRPIMERMRTEAAIFFVADHHESARADMMGFAPGIFETSRSGAVLAWQYFHPAEMIPTLLLYVEDRDLWRFALPQSREVSVALWSYPREFGVWSSLAFTMFARLKEEGSSILRYQRQIVQQMSDGAHWRELGGQNVLVANAACCYSEVGEYLLQKNPEINVSAYYMDRADGKRQWGSRSRNGEALDLAKRMGGGGHPNAAGWVEELEKKP